MQLALGVLNGFVGQPGGGINIEFVEVLVVEKLLEGAGLKLESLDTDALSILLALEIWVVLETSVGGLDVGLEALGIVGFLETVAGLGSAWVFETRLLIEELELHTSDFNGGGVHGVEDEQVVSSVVVVVLDVVDDLDILPLIGLHTFLPLVVSAALDLEAEIVAHHWWHFAYEFDPSGHSVESVFSILRCREFPARPNTSLVVARSLGVFVDWKLLFQALRLVTLIFSEVLEYSVLEKG